MAEIGITGNAVGNTQGTQFNSGLNQNNIQQDNLGENRIRQAGRNEGNVLNETNQTRIQQNENSDLRAGGARRGGNVERRRDLTGQNNPLIRNDNFNSQVDLNTERTGDSALRRTEQSTLLDNNAGEVNQVAVNQESPVERGVQRTEQNQLENIAGNNARIANQTPANISAAPGINEESQLGNKVDLLA